MARRWLTGCLVAMTALCAPASAYATFLTDEVANFAASTGRIQAWLADPAFLAAPAGTDPARAVTAWSPARGRALEVEWRNRYGARISGHLFAPREGDGPFPAAVVVPGAGVGEAAYWWIAEDLAEHGYVALVFDPQGQGASDVAPAAKFCEATGAWRKPQELGLREQGACAGEDPAEAAVSANTSQVAYLAQARAGRIDPEVIGPTYRALAPRFVLGAFDATDFLLSAANPWRSLVDATRLAVVGHSVGAYAANMTANGDPAQRFRAAVAMDAFYANDHGVVPRVPTLMLQSEQESLLGPRLEPVRDPRSATTLHPTRATYAQFVEAGVDAAFLVPAASSHSDFTDALQPASFLGQRTSSLAMIAWMDEYVAGRGGVARILSDPVGPTADTSSIGTGRPRIAGRRHRELFSALFPSDVDLARRSCRDLHSTACGAPPRCVAKAAVTAERKRRAVSVRVRWRGACGRVHAVDVSMTRSGRRVATSSRLVASTDTFVTRLAIPSRARHRTLTLTVRIDGVRARSKIRV